MQPGENLAWVLHINKLVRCIMFLLDKQVAPQNVQEMIATHLFRSLDYFERPNKLLGQTKQAGWNIPPNLDSNIHMHVLRL